jgi:predicted transport protein
MENYGRKERVPVEEYTIEHIMPQNENLSGAWRDMLGPDWERVHHERLHTLGNLTLTGYNAEYSDRPFTEKRDMSGGFRDSPLRLNQGLGQIERWDEAAMQARAESLAALARKVWGGPPPSEHVVALVSPSRPGYSIEDHPHLVVGPMREVFDAFRKEVCALDPCVTEEFLKLYVAYKAESNFVDVIPQAKRLLLSLNIEFPELYDPHGISRDVTGLGRWGNGNVEVSLSTVEHLPYVMGLVRQALEQQLGNGGGT